jgi:hypothetical protein
MAVTPRGYGAHMVTWHEIEQAEPVFAADVRERFDADKHKFLATLRADGAPRISGIETIFAHGELWLGMMTGSRKALDLRRDPRFALHSASSAPPDDPSAWAGDAKLSGVAVEVADPAERARGLGAMGDAGEAFPEAHVFRLDIREVVHTRVGDPADHLLIRFWSEEAGLREIRRA